MFTVKVMNLSVMKDCNHWRASSVTPKVVLRRISSMSWSIVSKAADRSKTVKMETCPWFVLPRRQLVP